MNALQSYSSDDNSGDECKPKQSVRGGGGGGGDHGTNYDDVGMDISEDSGDDGLTTTSGSGASSRVGGGRDDSSRKQGSASLSVGNKSPASANGGHHNHHHRDGPEPRRGLLPLPGIARVDGGLSRGAGYSDRGYRDGVTSHGSKGSAGDREEGCRDKEVSAHGLDNGNHRTGEAAEEERCSATLQQSKEDKQYSSLQERLLGLASGKVTESADGPAKREGSARRSHDERRSSRDDRRSRSPKDRPSAAAPPRTSCSSTTAPSSKSRRSSRSPSHRSGGGRRSPRSRSPKDERSKSKEKRSRSKDRRSKSKDKKGRSGSKDKRSRSKDRRSRSRDRRSRSRSRDRRDRRRRSRSRDRRRDHRKEGGSKPGLLPLPTAMPTPHPPPLLAMPLIPPLPSYYNPNSVNALKYAEQERKKKLLWGNKSASEGGAGAAINSGAISGLLSHTPSTPCSLGSPQPPPALLALARNNPTGRELNLGLGKNQFSVGSGPKNLLTGGRSLMGSGAGGRELNLGLGSSQPSGGGLRAAAAGGSAADKHAAGGGMVDLWATTTFNNDTDGKVAEKFKRLMGVKHTTALSAQGGGTPGEKLTEKQENMFTNMERQYEVARLATHTHKGFGLGFTSSAYLPK